MGGRYGGDDDGSSEYQDRRPDETDRSTEQQTIAEAVQAVADQQHQSTEHRGSQHPFASIRASSGGASGVDSGIAEYIADQIEESAHSTAEEVDPDE